MVEYIVPAAGHIGGIQQFALAQVPYLDDVVVTDWSEPVGLTYRIGVRMAPPGVTSRLLRRRPVPPGVRHYWHVAAAMGREVDRAVITCHGTEVLPVNTPGQRRALVEQALHEAAFVTAPSAYTAGLLAERFSLSGIEVVHPGIDVRAFPARNVTARLTVGTLTRFVPRKNVATLVDALAHLRSSGVDLHFRLAGDGPERERVLERLERSGISYEYLGRISEEDKISSFYPSLDVFALPVRPLVDDVEGFGIVYIEAAATGVPSVATGAGGSEDAVSDGVSGRFADPSDAADIARAILEASELPAEPVREWAGRFSEADTAERFRVLYRRIEQTQAVP